MPRAMMSFSSCESLAGICAPELAVNHLCQHRISQVSHENIDLTTEENMKPKSISVFGQPARLSSRKPIRPAVGPRNLRGLAKRLSHRLLISFLIAGLFGVSLRAQPQEGRGTVSGRVMGPDHAALQGARVELQPTGLTTVSDSQGQFTIPDVPAGKYTFSVSYLGFAPYSAPVSVTAGGVTQVDAVVQLEAVSESVIVRGERERGELEALNRERTADNIVQVLPAEVIMSLPNTNVADALGRLPGVSLERDEGEGKYIQIRGTEPRLSNVTINGIHVPSPEGVRNVKLDVIPADLVDMVEISKTLSANQDADAIGGSVNLVTKSAADKPYVSILGMGGYTPIGGGRKQYQFAGTAGQRFGPDKKLGLLFGGSYDHNPRGIDDIEPSYAPPTLVPTEMDLRNHLYNRTRYGFGGEADYKIGDMSSVYLRGLYSKFNDFGEQWAFTPGISNFITDPATCSPGGGVVTAFNGPTGCGGV